MILKLNTRTKLFIIRWLHIISAALILAFSILNKDIIIITKLMILISAGVAMFFSLVNNLYEGLINVEPVVGDLKIPAYFSIFSILFLLLSSVFGTYILISIVLAGGSIPLSLIANFNMPA